VTRPTSVAAPPSQHALDLLRAREHPSCHLCGAHGSGLRLAFEVQPDGSVAAAVAFPRRLQGYPEVLHGGVTASVLDAAMTNALFSVRIVAVTAELTVRYVAPVNLGVGARVRAWVERVSSHSLCSVRAELEQGGAVVARASAKFLARRPCSGGLLSHGPSQPCT
jgi:acyl-coenzyme A thioesterase PaaI-like protein